MKNKLTKKLRLFIFSIVIFTVSFPVQGALLLPRETTFVGTVIRIDQNNRSFVLQIGGLSFNLKELLAYLLGESSLSRYKVVTNDSTKFYIKTEQEENPASFNDLKVPQKVKVTGLRLTNFSGTPPKRNDIILASSIVILTRVSSANISNRGNFLSTSSTITSSSEVSNSKPPELINETPQEFLNNINTFKPYLRLNPLACNFGETCGPITWELLIPPPWSTSPEGQAAAVRVREAFDRYKNYKVVVEVGGVIIGSSTLGSMNAGTFLYDNYNLLLEAIKQFNNAIVYQMPHMLYEYEQPDTHLVMGLCFSDEYGFNKISKLQGSTCLAVARFITLNVNDYWQQWLASTKKRSLTPTLPNIRR